MTEKQYNRLTTICFFVAAASSLVFGKLGHFDWVALLAGIASALLGVVTYFYNARSAQTLENQTLVERTAEPQRVQVPYDEASVADAAIATTGIEGIQGLLWENELLSNKGTFDVHRTSSFRYFRATRFAVRLPKDLNDVAVRQQQRLREQQLFLAEVEELVNRLSGTCEFELSLDGRFIIRPIQTSKAIKEASVEEYRSKNSSQGLLN